MNSMFELDMAFALEVVAAVAAAFLVMVAVSRTGTIKTFGIWVGTVGIVFSIFGMICTSYYGIAYWREGIYSPKSVAAMQQMGQTMGATMGSMRTMQDNMQEMMGSGNVDKSEPDQPAAPGH